MEGDESKDAGSGNKMKYIVTVILALAIVFACVSLVAITAASSAESTQSEFVPNEVIVGFNEKVTKGEGASTIRNYGGTLLRRNDALNSVLVRVDDEQAFIKQISRAPAVKYAERNGIVYALASQAKKMFGDSSRDYTPNDPRWNEQWGPQSIKCTGAWQKEQGSTGVIITIVDTGIDYNHEDLTHYVTGGYDFVNYDDDPWDDAGHGTHCAGIAAATIDNAIGIAGVAQVGIMAEKVLNEYGSGTAFGVSQGITHATDFGADVISMSLGGSGYSSTMANACQYGWDAGAILVAASGNDGMAPVSYPAWYDTVICVGSIAQSDLISGFSNYGAKMELVAPGESILSTMPGDTYAYKGGTSMATPHVAGVAALVLSHYPGWTNSDVRANLQVTAVDLGSSGWDQYYGYGKVDANAALLLLPHLSIEKSDNPDPVPPGGTLNYSIIVNNYGYAAATNVSVTETYDRNVTFDSAVPAPSSGNDTWLFPSLKANESRWINISVSVNLSTPLGTVLHNIVNVSCAEGVTNSYTEDTIVFSGEQNCTCGGICVITTGWWRDGGAFHPSDTPIQDAIDNASAGETICVKDGTYNENVDVNKRLTIRSENGAASTIVNALDSDDHVFEVIVDYVSISGFTVKGATGREKAGICLGGHIDHCNISDNKALDNNCGIYLWQSSNNLISNNIASSNIIYGIRLSSVSSSNTISNNTVSSNNYGIRLDYSSGITITDNTASGNRGGGICLYRSSNNTITDNNASSNRDDGICLLFSSSNTISNNTASSNDYGIRLSSSSSNTITDNIASSNNVGILLYSSSNNIVSSNTASNNDYGGIYLQVSSNCNMITDNTASNNDYGIDLSSSSSNTISYNIASSDIRGIGLCYSSSNNTIADNIASSNNVGILLYSSSNNIVSSNTASNNDYGGIYLAESNYNKITSNTASNNDGRGIYLAESNYNTITSNTASNSERYGFVLDDSNNNVISNNTASNNDWYGINLDDSNNNHIYNNYFNNTNNALDDRSNIWNITKTAGPNIIGGSWLGGNYWGDYEGIDANSDGLGDTLLPYNSNGDILVGGDRHPLVPAGIAPLLSIEKSDNPDPVQPSGRLNYSISVHNVGYMATTNVLVTETYDINVAFVSAIPTPSSGNDTWTLPALNANETKWINISVTVNPSTPIETVLHNIVNVTCDQGVTDTDTEATTVLSGEPNCTCGDICVITTGWWREGGAFHPSDMPIQDAIDNADASDTICVKDGEYNENVDVNKRLTLKSENGAAPTTVNALYTNDHVFEVTADYVSISGFTVNGATSSEKAGIYLGSNIDHCNIYDNNALDNYAGILGESSSYNTITNNTASNNDYGIRLRESNDNTITNNTVSNNDWEGINLGWSSNYNTITSNIAQNNNGGIGLSSSSSNTIHSNTASSNYYGIILSYSSSNTIHSNTASSNYYGIRLYLSSNNNHIYNNYFDNTNNAEDDGNNIWNITKTAGTNIISGSWQGGNYWSDYAGIDANGDGLGDTLLPYNANGNILTGGDMHPLVPAGFAPLLLLEKSDDTDPVPPGGRLNYSIIVNNVGYMTTTNVIVTETYDANVTFDSAVPVPSSGNNVWTFPALNANETRWINISVSVNPTTPIGTVLHNIVKVTCDQGVTDTDTEVTTVFSGEQNCTCGDICVITTGWWRDGGAFHASNTPIQAAIDNAISDETICVKGGTYQENVDVDKRLTLKSDNGAAATTVNALYPNDHVFEVTADYVSIYGFTVKGAIGGGEAGISLGSNIDHCNIYDNKASGNYYGIYLRGSSNNNTISGNTVSNNDQNGIYLEWSSYNAVTSNIALDNNCGIYLYSSSGNTISDNTASDNGWCGIYLSSSSNNTIHSNTASRNDYGIHLYSSSNTNLIYNNYFNNTQNNARDDGINIWNITKTAGTNIISGSWQGGNYWSDYAGIDANGDGLGDTLLPYNANGEIIIGGDMHPLVPVGFAPLLSLEKTDDPDPVQAGGRLNYSIIVSNNGYINASAVTVTETYDANVTFDSAIPAPSSGNNVWIFPALNANESKWINISVIVNPSIPIGTVLHNIVNATCDQGVTDTDTEATTVFSGEQNCTCGDICVITTGWWRDGGAFHPRDTPIQNAIDTAISGETICVKDGEYNENVDVNKRLTIRSENGAAYTTVNTLYPNDHVFEVTADYVSISGFTVRGATGGGNAGIWLGSNIDHCNISDNNASDNYYGIYMTESSYNMITSNTFSNKDRYGIYLRGSSNYNTIISNIALNNNYGIYLSSSSSNTISNNTASSNGYGIYLSHSSNNTISDNTASSNNHGIRLYYSSSNTITSNAFSNNDGYGIYLYRSSNYNSVTSNIALNNDYGIRLYSSSNNTIHSNTASSNDYGIDLYSSSNDNRIYNNYFNNFQNNARDDGSNIWDITPTLGENILGGSWLAGNYWSDYAGIDANGDGLGDTFLPYNANGEIIIGGDMHPLVPAGFAPLLAVEKSDKPDPVPPGGRLDYTIIVNNVGYVTTTNVTVTETYDMNVTYDSAIPEPSSGNNMWIFPALNANETKWINISVTVNSSTPIGTVLHNIVNVTCDQGVTDTDTEATTVFSGEQNCTCGDICVVTTGWWRDGGAFHSTDTPIQDAIENANAGDTICVKDGTYTENVDVDKRLTIRSENGAAYTTVNAVYSNDHVFEVTADYANISGFTVKGATEGSKAGIWLGSNIDHCNIYDNNASDNSFGIYMTRSSDNAISSNTVSNNDLGIYLESSSNYNSVTSNIALNNDYGIHLSSSSNNTITSNIALGSSCGIELYYSSSNTIHSNTASSNDYGIELYYSSNNNRIYNNYFNNTQNNAQDDGSNIWDITPTLGENIIGGSWLAGNYWSDYAGIDANGDGLGDTFLPYNANGKILIGGDMHPLVPAGIAPLLSLEKSDKPDPIPPGGRLNYSIIVNNIGYQSTTNVTVTETYDMNVAYDLAIPAPSVGNATWIFPALNANERKWINISVSVNPSTPIGTVLQNIVNVTCDQGVTDTDTEATTVFYGEQNCTCGDICVVTTGWWRDGGAFQPTDTPIQDAIDNAITGETICVKDGTYQENVDVDMRLTIRSENGADSTTVNALYSNDHVFEVTADYASITGFTIKGATGGGKAGIWLGSNIEHCNIYDSKALDNNYGIYLSGSSKYHTISGNTVSNNNGCGIYLEWSSNNNTISGNTVSNNNWCGIRMSEASYNSITSNIALGSNCGIELYYSSSNTITNNTASSNDCGILLYYSSSNTVTDNTASSNDCGIRLYSTSNNNLIYNNYFNNTRNNAEDDGSNIWNITKTAGVNIIGGSWQGGNYWSDYAGIDGNGDGLGDTLLPYNANGDIIIGGDMHPLVPAGIAPLLSVEKTDDPDPVQAGDTLNYSIIVSNNGYINASAVTVTEIYDTNVTFDLAIPAPSSGNDTWLFPALNANETKKINISVSVNQLTAMGTVLHNTVNVSCTEGATDSDTEATTVFSGVPHCTCGDICVITTGWWRGGGVFHPSDTPIQDAIENAGTGDTICVKDGTYTENVDVDKQLTIRSENGAESTTVNALYLNDHVFEVTANYVSILGFSVNGATGGGRAGIWLGSNLEHCNISDNKALVNYYGIYMSGSSKYHTITGNTVANNDYCGIYMSGSNNNAISSNIALNNNYGICLSYSSGNAVSNNTASSNNYGIRLSSSCNNNRIYNNYFNNTENNAQDNGRNIWNIAPTLGQNIIGGYWQGGNYWSDYTGMDTNGDGLGDTLLPYTSNGGILKGGDYHPLAHTASGIELEKWVKYKDESDSEYRKAIENATICNNVTFKIAIRNKGGGIELTNLVVTDVLNCRLGYVEGSAIPDTTYANNCPDNQTLMWTFSVLEPLEYTNITFDACIDECGNDTNYADVVAVNEAGYTVVDDDTVWVNCTAPVSIETATGTGIASFWTDSGTIEDLVAVDESTLPEEGKPPLVFPHGFFSFNITGLTPGQTVLVTILFPDSLPVGTQYWKYHASEGGWVRIPMGSDDGDKVITITLVDGGLGDDYGIADGVIVDQGGPGVPLPMLAITKSSSPTTVAPGGTVTYTINCSNSGAVELTNVTITENYPEGVTFISADPAPDPGTNNMWTIGVLPVGKFRTITITVKVPESRDLSFTESGSVTGEGFVMVSKDLSTEQEPYTLKNVVTISCAEAEPVTASALTTVSGVPGTSLEITEHGSGNYTSEEILNLETKNKSIGLQKSTEAKYQPTTFNFSDSFSVNFTTRWMQDICSKNMVLGDAVHKKIKDATYIKDDTITETGAYGTSMEFDSSFYGAAHIGTVSKDANTSEDYIGEFELYWAAKEECQYLFNWSRVPGNDSEKLIRYLVDDLAINWAKNATITKSDDDRIINISTYGRSAEVILAANNETATVKVGNETIYVLDVRTEDGTLNVYDCRLKEMSESATGEGYVMLDKELASGHIQVIEHGSGIYSSDTDFDSQQLNKSTDAEYQPTTFNFSDDFGVNFSSKWVQGICSKDREADTAIQKKISNAASIEDDTTATKSSMAFETSVNGSIHIGARTNGTRISEDYIGLFNITERIKIGKTVNVPTATSVPDWLPCPFPEPGVSTPPSDLSCPYSDP